MLSKTDKDIFSILFASGEPVEVNRIAVALGMDLEATAKLIVMLSDRLEEMDFPVEVLKMGDRYQLATKVEMAPVVQGALELKRNLPLSQAAMEVLAIIAYNQPVTKSFVEQIRGVDSSSIVNSLVEKNLVEEMGRLQIPGRPIAYGTSTNFLRCFSLSSLEQLPKVEYSATSGEIGEKQVDAQIEFEDLNL